MKLFITMQRGFPVKFQYQLSHFCSLAVTVQCWNIIGGSVAVFGLEGERAAAVAAYSGIRECEM